MQRRHEGPRKSTMTSIDCTPRIETTSEKIIVCMACFYLLVVMFPSVAMHVVPKRSHRTCSPRMLSQPHPDLCPLIHLFHKPPLQTN